MSYLDGIKGWRFWVPVKNTFIELTHTRWIDDKENTVNNSAPIPDPSLSPSLSRILNMVDAIVYKKEVQDLVLSFSTEFRLEDPYFTNIVRTQE